MPAACKCLWPVGQAPICLRPASGKACGCAHPGCVLACATCCKPHPDAAWARLLAPRSAHAWPAPQVLSTPAAAACTCLPAAYERLPGLCVAGVLLVLQCARGCQGHPAAGVRLRSKGGDAGAWRQGGHGLHGRAHTQVWGGRARAEVWWGARTGAGGANTGMDVMAGQVHRCREGEHAQRCSGVHTQVQGAPTRAGVGIRSYGGHAEGDKGTSSLHGNCCKAFALVDCASTPLQCVHLMV